MYSIDTTKYYIHMELETEGVVEKSDVVGAIFGQTEGLLGDDLDLRDLQRTGRVGRIDVQINSKNGETRGKIHISSSLDKAETALLAASLETIDRVGPCNSRVKVEGIEDIRISKRKQIVERAKELIIESFDEGTIDTNEILDAVREYSRIEKVVEYGEDNLPAGPNVKDSDAIIIVEGRADVVNLLRYGIKNAIAVEGTNVPKTIVEISESKTTTVFVDGDRGGDLILSELLQVADVDYIAVCPRGKNVEEMTRKEIIKPLRNKVPVEFYNVHKSEGRHSASLGTIQTPEVIAVGEDANPLLNMGTTDDSSPTENNPLVRHMSEVSGHHTGRILSSDYNVLKEFSIDDIEEVMKDPGKDATGLVTDRSVNQWLIDLIVSKGIEYIVAPDFKNIIKKPVSLRLLKIP